jgi:prepilin-type N-terminal cleavage/methylation domain-containing protein
MKQMMHKSKQQGFTLLELLVVITLLAVLSVGALVAYEGIGDNAQATAAANNTAGVDRAIRNFRAVSLTYPNQWDNLSASATAAPFSTTQVATVTKNTFGDWAVGAADVSATNAVVSAFGAVGITAIQQIAADLTVTGVAPNLQHNEGANPGAAEDKLNSAAFTHVSIVPSVEKGGLAGIAGTACTAGGQSISAQYSRFAADGLTPVNVALDNALASKLNAMHDSLEDDECQLVVALGFGHDAAHSTASSKAAIVTAASYSSTLINPATNYARYIALFHLGTDGDADHNIAGTEVFAKARLLGIVDTEGNPIDANIAKATAVN